MSQSYEGERPGDSEPCGPGQRRCLDCGAPHERRRLYAVERGGELVLCWACRRGRVLAEMATQRPLFRS